MFKRIKSLYFIILIGLCTFIFNLISVKAACSISVSAPKSAVVGSTFKVTTSVSSDAGAWTYVLSYDSSKVQLVSGSTKVVGVIGDSKSNSYTFKALSSGSTTFKVVNTDIALDSTKSKCSVSSGSATITMKTQAEIEASYSKNNNLASLSVEGAELTPEFKSDVLEYEAELPVDTTIANISATVQDKTATIEGIGEKEVVDGLNKIEVVVTAQHGEKKTYVINLTVKELDPINVKVGNKNYTVVRKKGLIENIPVGFEEDTIKINDIDVACYKNKVSKLTLVGLKDEKGNIKLFIYKNDKYEEFKLANSSSINLLILEKIEKKIPEGFIKTTFKIDDNSYSGYKYKGSSDDFYLVYAQNLENGNKDFYLFDKKGRTFQRFNSELLSVMQRKMDYLEYIILGLGIIILIIIIVKIFSKDKNKYDGNNKINDDLFNDSVKNLPNIKQIDDDEYVMPKKSKKQKLEEIRKAKEKLDKSKPTYKNF